VFNCPLWRAPSSQFHNIIKYIITLERQRKGDQAIICSTRDDRPVKPKLFGPGRNGIAHKPVGHESHVFMSGDGDLHQMPSEI
jgi:hypothetical protein